MNIERSEEQQLDNDIASVGVLLKRARLDLGLTIEEVADRLKLRVTVVREIEDNCCDDGQTTFIRGYIRSYAKLLGLDADEILNTYSDAYQVETVEHQMQSFSKKTQHQQIDKQVMNLTWLIFSIVVGITTIWWWQNQTEDELITESLTIPEDELPSEVTELIETPSETPVPSDAYKTDVYETSEPIDVQTPVSFEVTEPTPRQVEEELNFSDSSQIASPSPSAKMVQTSQPSTSDVLVNIASVTPSIVEPKATEKKEIVLSSTMTLRFTADCWVDIRDANGKRMLTGIKSAGDSVELSGQTPFKLVLGAPSVVDLTFDGESVDLSRYAPKQVARFSLPIKI